MDMLLKQLRALPAAFAKLSSATRMLLIAGLVAALAAAGVLAMVFGGAGESYQYAFTNLTPEDSAEAAQTLKGVGIPFRLEAGGAALAVPGHKVYDARLLLATAGLPRGGGVGFELFDRGDLGVSEFTQKVNLRRALEGELARTIGRLSEVRSARVHLTLSEKGLYRDDDRKASAAVVLNLQPGRTLGDKELAGIRHLVASGAPGMAVDAVTVVDGRGTVLTSDSASQGASDYQRKMEQDLERRIVSILEPVVGPGSVVARVSANLDVSEVKTDSEVFDPDAVALRSERKWVQAQSQDSAPKGDIAGAAANQALGPATATQAQVGAKASSNGQDETRNYEISKTVTSTVARHPRLQRLSVAVLLDGVKGKPRQAEEVARLGELAKRAVGFDMDRGDQIDVSSSVFQASEAGAEVAAVTAGPTRNQLFGVIGAAALLIVILLGVLLMRGRRALPAPVVSAPVVLTPGARVSEIEAAAQTTATLALEAAAAANPPLALPDPTTRVRDRARELAGEDPARVAMLLRAWIQQDAAANSEVNHA